VGGVSALAGQDAGRDLYGLDVLGEGGGHAEYHPLVLALLLSHAMSLYQGLGGEVYPPDGGSGGAGDAAARRRQLLDGAHVDDGMQYLVEPPGLYRIDDERVVHYLPAEQVEVQLKVGLGALRHHLPLLDEPQLVLLDREPDLAYLLVMVL